MADAIDELRRELATLRQQVASLSAALKQRTAPYTLSNGAFPFVFPAGISGSTFTEKTVSGSSLAARPAPARSGSFIKPSSSEGVMLAMRTGSAMSYVLIKASDVQYVDLTQTGGSAGSKTTACTFTYTVKDSDGNTLGMGISPVMGRPTLGKFTAATHGLVRFATGSTTPILFWCDEVKTTVGC